MLHSLLVVPSPHLLSNLSDSPLTPSPTRSNSNIRTYPPAYHQPYFLLTSIRSSHPSKATLTTAVYCKYSPDNVPDKRRNIVNNSLLFLDHFKPERRKYAAKVPQKHRSDTSKTLYFHHIYVIFAYFRTISHSFLQISGNIHKILAFHNIS